MAKGGRLKTALDTHRSAQKRKEREAAAADARHRKEQSILAGRSGKGKAKKGAIVRSAAAESSQGEEGGVSSSAQLRKRRRTHPFAADDTILLVAYDSEVECYRKYPDARNHVERIRAIADRKDIVVFGVDAGALEQCKAVVGAGSRSKGKGKGIFQEDEEGSSSSAGRWSKVWFGFPHVGAGHKDETRNILANQLMLLRFFVSVAPFLTKGPLPSYAVPGSGKKGRSDVDDDVDDEDLDDLVDDLNPAEEVQMSDAEDEGQYLPTTAAEPSARDRFVPPARQGSVLVTLRNAAPYTHWIVPTLARRLLMLLAHISKSAPTLPRGQTAPTTDVATRTLRAAGCPANGSYAVWRSFEFEPDMWAGYSHRRTVGWVEGLSTGDNEDILRRPEGAGGGNRGVKASKAGGGECRTWEFGLEVQDAKNSRR